MLTKGRAKLDDALVAKLSELTFDRVRSGEIFAVIERDVQKLAQDVTGGPSGRRSTDDLRGRLAEMMRARGEKVEQKQRLCQLAGEAERLAKKR
jgi:hypothetical protein